MYTPEENLIEENGKEGFQYTTDNTLGCGRAAAFVLGQQRG
jgi:hypothetical protein